MTYKERKDRKKLINIYIYIRFLISTVIPDDVTFINLLLLLLLFSPRIFFLVFNRSVISSALVTDISLPESLCNSDSVCQISQIIHLRAATFRLNIAPRSISPARRWRRRSRRQSHHAIHWMPVLFSEISVCLHIRDNIQMKGWVLHRSISNYNKWSIVGICCLLSRTNPLYTLSSSRSHIRTPSKT